VAVNKAKRTTIYFEPALYRALRIKAGETETSISDIVNAAVRQSLTEDAADVAIFKARAREPVLAFEDMLKDLKRPGRP
jgi:hypothetical protein